MAIKFSKLTRTHLRSLKSNQRISEHGITFERLASGDGRFSINVMVDGKRIHRVIGKESDGATRKQAEYLIAKLKTDARESRLNLPKRRKLVLSFKEAADTYLQRQEAEGAKNLVSKRYQLKLHLIPFFIHTPLDKINSFDIERYKKLRTSQGVKPATINRELAALSHLFTKAVEWRWLETKPTAIKKYKEEQSRITYLTTEQAARLLEAAKQDSNPYIYLFIAIGLQTAMRRMEILSIKLSDIELDKKIIHIPKAKAGARQQPITSYLANLLQTHLNNAEENQIWLFPAPNSSTGHTVNIEKPFRRVVSAAGLDTQQVIRHTLRHTAITHLVQAGVDLPTVKRISGHKTLQMVERYSHQNGRHIQTAMDKLEQKYKNSC